MSRELIYIHIQSSAQLRPSSLDPYSAAISQPPVVTATVTGEGCRETRCTSLAAPAGWHQSPSPYAVDHWLQLSKFLPCLWEEARGCQSRCLRSWNSLCVRPPSGVRPVCLANHVAQAKRRHPIRRRAGGLGAPILQGVFAGGGGKLAQIDA